MRVSERSRIHGITTVELLLQTDGVSSHAVDESSSVYVHRIILLRNKLKLYTILVQFAIL